MFRTIFSGFLVTMSVIIWAQDIITFEVDMNEIIELGVMRPDSSDKVALRTGFSEWTTDHILNDVEGNGIYSGTFEMAGDSGSSIQYKFVILRSDGLVLWEDRPNPENPDHGNRMLTRSGSPIHADIVSFALNKYHLALAGKLITFDRESLESDFLQFRKALEENHCCLYDYTGKREFDKLFDHQFRMIKDGMGPVEFFRILTPLTAKIGCGHTNVWMPGEFWDIEPGNLFPLKIKMVGDYTVVAGSYNEELEIPRGSILLEINGRPVTSVIKEMKRNYSADAFNPYFIASQVERRFSMLYARRFGFPEKWEVVYALPGKRTRKTATLKPASVESVRAVVFSNFHHPDLELELDMETGTAIMTIPTFIYYSRVDYFTNFLDSSFTEIRDKSIRNLVLDLRGNDGGDPFCAAPLFSYLEPVPLPYFAERYGKYSYLADPVPRAEKAFEGNLYILMDGRCFSTNAHFCALLKYHHIGTFIGTPSGGTYVCNAGSNGRILLDNTKMQLYFARNSFAVAVEGMDKTKPIMPDKEVIPSYYDFLEGRDITMERAMSIIISKNKEVDRE